MSNNEVRYVHVRKPRLDYTIAYIFDHDRDNEIFNVNYGIAQCGKNDTFVRATGRKIATNRLTKGMTTGTESLYFGALTIPATPGVLVSRVIQEIFEETRSIVLAELDAENTAEMDELDELINQLNTLTFS